MDWAPSGCVPALQWGKTKTKQTRRVIHSSAFRALKLASLARCRAPAQTQGSGHNFNHIADHVYHLMCEWSVGTSVVSLRMTVNVPFAWTDRLPTRLKSKGCKSGTWLKLKERSWCYSVKPEIHFKTYLSCWMTELRMSWYLSAWWYMVPHFLNYRVSNFC